jgi:hypothetical protein
MSSNKRRTAIAVTVAVWVVAAASAAALTLELTRTPRPAREASEVAAPLSDVNAVPSPPLFRPEPVLEIAAITIVGHAPPRRVAPRAPSSSMPESPMRCAESRALDMGSGRVSVCE